MEKEILQFSASTNVKDLFGRGLVTDPFAAIFELVKNSYDADADTVELTFQKDTLIIKDNGSGMSFEDIKTKWMTIGTNNKKGNGHSPKYHRTYNGDKGIGRFATDCLGAKLEMTSLPENEDSKYKVFFDWNLFEKYNENISSISIEAQVNKKKNINSKGVGLKITELRNEWSKNEVNDLIKQLRKFKSPFEHENNFNIYVTAEEYEINSFEIVKYDLEDISTLWLQSEISKDDLSKIKVKIYHDGEYYTEEFLNEYAFGPVKTELYFFNRGEKITFSSRIGTRVKDFGHIRLYLDNFKIHPYGESYDDWLRLDKRHAQGTSRFFSTRDLIGYAQVFKDFNKNIIPTTDRQGLIQNNDVGELRNYIIDYGVKILEKYFFQVKKAKNEQYIEIKNESKVIQKNINDIVTDLKKINPDVANELIQVRKQLESQQRKQDKYIKEQQEITEIYKRNASKEMLLNKIIHQALINIDTGDTVIKELKEYIINDKDINKSDVLEMVDELDVLIVNTKNYLLQTRDNLITERKRKNIKLSSFFEDVISNYNSKMRQDNITSTIEIDDRISLFIDPQDLKGVIENFVSNSIKALNKVEIEGKSISVKVIETPRNIIIKFNDNGPGIPEHLRDRIFDPFYSTTGGFGMGLSIVDEIIKKNYGELNILKTVVGAGFQIKFRR